MAAEIAGRPRRRRLLPGVRLGRPPAPGRAGPGAPAAAAEKAARKRLDDAEVEPRPRTTRVRDLRPPRLGRPRRRPAKTGPGRAPRVPQRRRDERSAGPSSPSERDRPGRRPWPGPRPRRPTPSPTRARRPGGAGRHPGAGWPPHRAEQERIRADVDALLDRHRPRRPSRPCVADRGAPRWTRSTAARTHRRASRRRRARPRAEAERGPARSGSTSTGSPRSTRRLAAVLPTTALEALDAEVATHDARAAARRQRARRPRPRGRRGSARPGHWRRSTPPCADRPATHAEASTAHEVAAARATRLAALDTRPPDGARRLGARSASRGRWPPSWRPSSRASAPTTRCGCGSPPTSCPARLRQVVAAANERLAAMSDQRYTLEHTGAPRRRREPRRAEPAGPRRVERRAPRPGHAVRRRDVRGLPRPRPRAGRRGRPTRPAAPSSTPCSSTRASAPWTPTRSTT